jgi:hypothetical protein
VIEDGQQQDVNDGKDVVLLLRQNSQIVSPAEMGDDGLKLGNGERIARV